MNGYDGNPHALATTGTQTVTVARQTSGKAVAMTALQMSGGYLTARVANRYVDQSGLLDKSIPDAKNRAYARGALAIGVGALLMVKTDKAKVFGAGMIVEGVAEAFMPMLDKFVDDQVAKARLAAAQQQGTGGTATGGTAGGTAGGSTSGGAG